MLSTLKNVFTTKNKSISLFGTLIRNVTSTPRTVVGVYQGFMAPTIDAILKRRNFPPVTLLVINDTFPFHQLHQDFNDDVFGQERQELPLALEAFFPENIITLKQYQDFASHWKLENSFSYSRNNRLIIEKIGQRWTCLKVYDRKNKKVVFQKKLKNPHPVSNLREPNIHKVPEYRTLQTAQEFLQMGKPKCGVYLSAFGPASMILAETMMKDCLPFKFLGRLKEDDWKFLLGFPRLRETVKELRKRGDEIYPGEDSRILTENDVKDMSELEELKSRYLPIYEEILEFKQKHNIPDKVQVMVALHKTTFKVIEMAIGNQAIGTKAAHVPGAIRIARFRVRTKGADEEDVEEQEDITYANVRASGIQSVAKFFYEYLTLSGKNHQEILNFLIEERILVVPFEIKDSFGGRLERLENLGKIGASCSEFYQEMKSLKL